MVSGGLCGGHYMQQRRRQELKPLRTARGEGDQLTLHMPRELREEAGRDAKKRGETEGEWWRAAGRERLERARKKGAK